MKVTDLGMYIPHLTILLFWPLYAFTVLTDFLALRTLKKALGAKIYIYGL